MPPDAPAPRWGLSTGTCAAAAAKAAAICLTTGETPRSVDVPLPSGERVTLEVSALEGGRFGVVKDAGDDLDSTDGLLVVASVEIGTDDGPIFFRAGEGVGVVTLPGLKIPPGEPAINPVPRKMIEVAVREVVGGRGAAVTISIPGGERVAEKTFNKRLGIAGGLSILGTTGRVRPMDKDALFESISLELSTHAARGRSAVLLTFASTGEAAARRAWNLPEGYTVQIANEIGFALETCVRLGIRKVLVAGHPGKMLKIASGAFNTHSRVADGRFESLCTHAALATGDCGHLPALYECRTTEAAMDLMKIFFDTETRARIWLSLAARAAERCGEFAFGELETAAAFVDNDGEVLGASENISDVLCAIREFTQS